MAQVKNPELLRKLNDGQTQQQPEQEQVAPQQDGSPNVGARVTDPETLAKLEGDEGGILNTIKSAAQDAYDFVEGSKYRSADYPELGTSGPDVPAFSKEGMRMAGAYATSVDPEQIADIAVKTLEGAQKTQDEQGNPVIEYKGQKYYVNRPGLSEADFFQFLGQTGIFAPAARLAGAAKSLGGRMLTAAGGSAASSAAADKASEALGSEQGVSPGRAMMAAATGGLFEGLSPIATKAWRGIFNKSRFFDPSTGQLTDEGRRAAQAAELDPDAMNRKLAEQFSKEAQDAVNPDAYGRQTAAKEFDIPLTRGQATRSWDDLANEQSLRRGAKGDKAGNIMRDFDELQNQRIAAAADRVQESVGGGTRNVAQSDDAGRILTSGLSDRLEQQVRRVDDAYDALRATDARLNVDSLSGLAKRARSAVEDYDIDPELMPSTVRAFRQIGRLGKEMRKQQGGRVTKLSLRRLENQRRKLNNLIDSAKNRTDKAAATRVRNAYDEYLQDAADNALFEGDDEALNLLKQARAERRTQGHLFGKRDSKDEAGRVIQKMLETDPTPEKAVNYVFGKANLGSRDASGKVVDRLREIFGDDSTEMAALREAAFRRLTRDKAGNFTSPRKVARALDEAFGQNQTLMKSLFSDDQRKLLRRFSDAVKQTETPQSADNPSGTAYTLSRLARQFTQRLGTMATFSGNPGLGAGLFSLARTPTIMGGRAAKNATKPLPMQRPRGPAFTAGGQAATRGAQE
jgi:hypothetical protein